MSGRIPQSFIDELLVRVDIVDLIEVRITLKKAGRNYIARCPFHDEKTPSFTVNREKQMFHCFGCGAGGNSITFIMDYDHLGFLEAVEDLADFAGLPLPVRDTYTSNHEGVIDLAAVYEIQKQVTTFYSDQLLNQPVGKVAINYLRGRGLTGDVARAFLLGFAPSGWDVLSNSNFDKSLLIQAGLMIKNEAGRSYDRFRNRIMFPIRDRRGRIIGFGGRVLDDSLPKYLNSPETSVFQKSKELYGLYELLQVSTKPNQILVVEGYMDVIALAQNGISYSVATLGTAMSKNHLEILFRCTGEIVFCVDGDEAGRNAAWRAVELALPVLRDGRQIRIMLLDSGFDPDSYVRKVGAEKFAATALSSSLLSDYFFEYLGSDLNLAEMESRAKIAAKAKPLIAQLPHGVFRNLMENRLLDLAQVDSIELGAGEASHHAGAKMNPPRRERVKPSPFRTALAILLQYPRMGKKLDVSEIRGDDSASEGIKLLLEVLNILTETPELSSGSLVERFRGNSDEKTIKVLAQYDLLVPENGLEDELSGAFRRIVQQENKNRLSKLLVRAEQNSLAEADRIELKRLLHISEASTQK